MAVPTLRDRKRERTREAIETAAFRLFAERGYDGVTVAQIAAAADVAPRTYFRYFATKEDVLFGRDAEVLDAVAGIIDGRPRGEDPVATARACSLAMGAWAEDHRALLVDRAAVIDATPSLSGRERAKLGAIEELAAARLARRMRAGAGNPLPLLLAKLATACFEVGVQNGLRRRAAFEQTIGAAWDALPLTTA
jgi:AcrR family transcriptional regulator